MRIATILIGQQKLESDWITCKELPKEPHIDILPVHKSIMIRKD